jgi:NAD(P)-dependent dehydrogenase (short-subunit alcohol dehydrogenase family)
VTVNNLAPGLILTDRTSALRDDPEVWRQKVDNIPLKRAGIPDDMVGAALLLCSDAGSYITGQDLFADGGMGFPGGMR